MRKRKVAIIGSGNIGTDLMIKILRHGQHLEMAVMVGIDPQSDGLARARRMGVATTHEGVGGLMQMAEFADIDFVFDATSAGAHVKNDAALREAKPGIRVIDLTPAAIGPYCVPVVNLAANLHQGKLNHSVVCQLLENPKFAELTRQIALYQEGVLASGVAAQNQMYNSMSSLMLEHGQANPEDMPAVRGAVQEAQALKPKVTAARSMTIKVFFICIS